MARRTDICFLIDERQLASVLILPWWRIDSCFLSLGRSLLAGPRTRSLARMAAGRPSARSRVRPPAYLPARALVRSLQTLFTRANFFGT